MASDEQDKILPIDYTHREFSTIRRDLMDLAERYYPENFQDFSDASFASMMIDAVAYVGDQLSFYLDYNVNESFLDTAFQRQNIVRHGRILGYKDPGRASTYGTATLYVLVPADSTGLGPDTAYIPILARGSSFSSQTGLSFVLTENVDFSNPSNPIVVARVADDTGTPTYYAIKASGNVVSGQFSQESVSVGAFQRFLTVKLSDANISEIISVVDSEGNLYYEVDYLSQDMVFKEVQNNNYLNDNVPSIIKPFLVSRKFIVERGAYGTTLQFGSGDAAESDVVVNPQSVALDIFGKSYVTDSTFDPTRLTKNQNFGICPANTNLTVTYRATNPMNSNVAAGALNKVNQSLMNFDNSTSLSDATMREIRNSLEVFNETPIIGAVTSPSATEIKRRVFDTFPTQNRAVTQADYENITYRMPAKYGSIKRVSVQKDPESVKRNLNLYVISEDSFGKLIKTNSTIKNNLKTWLNQYRMINDTIDILDPFVINLGVEFVVKPTAEFNRSAVLSRAIATLSDHFSKTYFIGEPLYISDIYSALKEERGILDVIKVKLVNKSGGDYSSVIFSVEKNLSPDGSYLMCPKNAVFEIKYPDIDLKGKIT